MMEAIFIRPGPLKGTIAAPPSKSAAHRALILAALSRRQCTVEGISHSEDMTATLNALTSLGFEMQRQGENIIFSGKYKPPGSCRVHCGESGSTLRFMVPVAAALGIETEFTGEGRLPSRPVDIYREILDGRGVEVSLAGGHLPMKIMGRLKSGTFLLPGNISSQFVTGLLLALPFVDGDSDIILLNALESAPYVDITLDVMGSFGLYAEKTKQGYHIRGRQRARADRYRVEGDFSQAAFWLCAGALSGPVSVSNLNAASLQGDKMITAILRGMGADVTMLPDGVTCQRAALRGTEIDAADIPDLVPALAALAAFCTGPTRIYNAGRLRHKESDRLAASADMVGALGGDISVTSDGLLVRGRPLLAGGRCSPHGDHRIAMAAAVAGTHTERGATLEDYMCVNKSYPGFFNDFVRLGGSADGLDMG